MASLKSSIRNELALQNVQELMNVRVLALLCFLSPNALGLQKVNDKCYAKCVPKPGTSLSSSEEVRCSSLFHTFSTELFGHRNVSRNVWTGTWKHVRCSNLYVSPLVSPSASQSTSLVEHTWRDSERSALTRKHP